ncbi:RNA-guided endonuclease InsQ/TnpB family protein [Catenulispora rubra]|uniref:RNA-guided endonuclease InsQ/TnpB family protein n=1 Tax=Catenulispora rubra TaxID=280293 RepID=UPI0018926F71|nr:RNA-guided endonuclease TnpB family protein [Catenulispora rubra]
MRLRYRYRLYPDAAQRDALARAFGCARVVYNDGLRLRQAAFSAGQGFIDDGELQKRVITQGKRTPERAWLSEVSSVVLIQSLRDLNRAYRAFFAVRRGERRASAVNLPRIKSKRDGRQAIRLTSNGFTVRDDGKLYLTKVGDVEVVWSRRLPAEPSSVTVVRDAAHRYWASFVVEVEEQPLPRTDIECGIDLGLTHFGVTSGGEKIAAPRFLRRAERKLRRLHRDLSRKQKGSANRQKARLKLARQHAKVADRRHDWHHQESTRVIRENQAVFVEDLAVAALGRTRLAKSIHDAGWTRFVDMLEYKAALYGREFAKIDRFAPTTKTCSCCGTRVERMSLRVREWDCPSCGMRHDRDVNAARNILALGRRERLNACGEGVRPERVPAAVDEAGTDRSEGALP